MKKRIFVLLVVSVLVAMFAGSTLNLQASSDKVYLSDLDGIVHNLIAGYDTSSGINKGLISEADTIVVGGVTYEKGFMTHPIAGTSPSEIIIDVTDLTTENPILHMIVGKDDAALAGGPGHPYKYEVLVDGNSIYLSEQMEVDSVEEMFFDVTGAKEIVLMCHCDGPFAWLTVNFADVYLCNMAVKEVSLIKAPLKIAYQTGEALSVIGGQLKVVYENDFEVEVDIDSSMITGFDSSVEGEQELTITYNGYSFTYTVNVEPAPTAAPTAAPTTAPTTAPDDQTGSKGCGSSAAIAQVMLVLGAALIIKKRK